MASFLKINANDHLLINSSGDKLIIDPTQQIVEPTTRVSGTVSPWGKPGIRKRYIRTRF